MINNQDKNRRVKYADLSFFFIFKEKHLKLFRM